MLILRKHFAVHRKWFAMFLAITAAAVFGYFYWAHAHATRLPGGSSPPGLILGILGGAIIIFECLLWPRRMLRSWRWGSARLWMKAHIWFGLLTVPLILLHSGFMWGGWLSTILALLFAMVIASGIFGLVMQQFLPRRMLIDTPLETIYSQIEQTMQMALADARNLVLATCGLPKESLEASAHSQPSKESRSLPSKSSDRRQGGRVVVGAIRQAELIPGQLLRVPVPQVPVPNCEVLRQKFNATIQPFLERGRRFRSPLSNRTRSAEFFRQLRAVLDPEAHSILEAIEECCEQRRQFDLQTRLHWWLHSWLWIHLPLSMALLVLMFVHAYVALKYW